MNKHNSGPIPQVGFLNVEHVDVQMCRCASHSSHKEHSEAWMVAGLIEIHVIDIIDR